MKMLKGVIFVLGGLFIMATIMGLLMPGKVVITNAEPMTGDSAKIFEQVSDLRNWKNWQPVFKADSGQVNFSTASGQVNSFAEWTTNGKKNRLLIAEKKYPFVKILLEREGETDVVNIISLMQVQEQGNMQVRWDVITKLGWLPWQRFGGLFIERMSGPGYETALKSLKEYIEAHQ